MKITDLNYKGGIDWGVDTKDMEFMKCEIAPLKEITPDIPVTTNLMGCYYGLDYFKFKDIVDVVRFQLLYNIAHLLLVGRNAGKVGERRDIVDILHLVCNINGIIRRAAGCAVGHAHI